MKRCNQNILRTIELTQAMIRLADQGDADREDTGCGVLYGVLRDSAYKLWHMAEAEKQKHQNKGGWSAQETQHTNLPIKMDGIKATKNKSKKEDEQ